MNNSLCKFLSVLAVMAFSFMKVESIKCFVCNAPASSYCGETMSILYDTQYLVDNCLSCTVNKLVYRGTTQYSRVCNILAYSSAPGCYNITAVGPVQSCSYTCNTEYCNSVSLAETTTTVTPLPTAPVYRCSGNKLGNSVISAVVSSILLFGSMKLFH